MQELINNYQTKAELIEDLGDDIILYIYQKSCTQCPPVKDLLISLVSHYKGLTVYSVCASGDNLPLCRDLKIDSTPRVVVIIGGHCGSPQSDPARIAEEVKGAANAQNRKETRSSELQDI